MPEKFFNFFNLLDFIRFFIIFILLYYIIMSEPSRYQIQTAPFGNAPTEMVNTNSMLPEAMSSQIKKLKFQIASLLPQIDPSIDLSNIDSAIQKMTANGIKYDPNEPNQQTKLNKLTALLEQLQQEKKGGKKQKSKRYRKSRKQRKTKTKRRLRRSYKYK